MKKVVFVVSHFGSGSFELVNILNRNPRVMIQNKQAKYENISNLDWLFEEKHKVDNTAAIYGDHLLTNASFSFPALYSMCKFIYMIRPARPSLNELLSTKNLEFSPKDAGLYYQFRLRRICEMATNTPGAVFVAWDDLASSRGWPLIEDYLGLNEPLMPNFEEFIETHGDDVPREIVDPCQDSYERHLYYLRHKNLVQSSLK